MPIHDWIHHAPIRILHMSSVTGPSSTTSPDSSAICHTTHCITTRLRGASRASGGEMRFIFPTSWERCRWSGQPLR